MVESLSDFPFRKLRFNKYLTLDVMMYVEHPEVYKFMFSVNKATRSFLLKNFITLRNGFINNGLITYQIHHNFDSYANLEKLYF